MYALFYITNNSPFDINIYCSKHYNILLNWKSCSTCNWQSHRRITIYIFPKRINNHHKTVVTGQTWKQDDFIWPILFLAVSGKICERIMLMLCIEFVHQNRHRMHHFFYIFHIKFTAQTFPILSVDEKVAYIYSTLDTYLMHKIDGYVE